MLINGVHSAQSCSSLITRDDNNVHIWLPEMNVWMTVLCISLGYSPTNPEGFSVLSTYER